MAKEACPPALGNFSCIIPGDMDSDGDMDLFIGGRVVPGNYGLIPQSFLFRNEGAGKWTDVTTTEIGTVGMVTSAIWSDYDLDEDLDLIVVGEWMPVTVFLNDDGNLVKNTISQSSGWWTVIKQADLDDDGDPDYVLGNWGFNTKFKASYEKPLSLFVQDFDNNGKTDFILNWYPPGNDEDYPFATKMDLTEQLPHLKKSILKYEEYAHKTYETLLTSEAREGAIDHQVSYLASAILRNDQGNLQLEALPITAQVAPVFGIVIEDFNDDDKLDIWLGGNFYGLKPEVGRHDSSKGVLLLGNGTCGFEYLTPQQSGIEVVGEVRSTEVLKTDSAFRLLVGRNDSELMVFEPATQKD